MCKVTLVVKAGGGGHIDQGVLLTHKLPYREIQPKRSYVVPHCAVVVFPKSPCQIGRVHVSLLRDTTQGQLFAEMLVYKLYYSGQPSRLADAWGFVIQTNNLCQHLEHETFYA